METEEREVSRERRDKRERSVERVCKYRHNWHRERKREELANTDFVTCQRECCRGENYPKADENGGRDSVRFLCCSECRTTQIYLSIGFPLFFYYSSIILHGSFPIMSFLYVFSFSIFEFFFLNLKSFNHLRGLFRAYFMLMMMRIHNS